MQSDLEPGGQAPPAGRVGEASTSDPTGNAEAETSLASAMAAIWADVLRCGHVGVHDDFFELGGHSLLATQITSRVRSILGLDVPLRAVFDHPTVASLIEWIDHGSEPAEAAHRAPAIVPIDRNRSIAASAAQARMFFLHELEPESAAYSIPDAVRLVGPLDTDALAAAFDDLVQRHEGLRTTFELEDGHPVQRVAPAAHVKLEMVDRRSVPACDRMAVVVEEIERAAEQPFRLDELPLMRCVLYVLDDNDHVLFVNVHHIVTDQWSGGVIGRDFETFYQERHAGRGPSLVGPGPSVTDYLVWHRGWSENGPIDAQLAYWRQQLANCPTVDLPFDRPRPSVRSGRGAMLTIPFPDRLRLEVDRLCARHRVSPFMVLLATLDVLVHRYSGTDDIVVGAPIANRNHLESESLVGTFVNSVVLRADLSRDPTFSELLAQVRRVALDAYANQDVPFAEVVNALRPTRDVSRTPLFQIFLNVLNAPVKPIQIEGVLTEVLIIDRGASQFDLSVALDASITKTISFEYSSDLFDRSTIERLAGHFLAVLAAVAADPEQRIGEIELFSDEERAELTAAWAGPVVDIEANVGAHSLFERQAAAAPDRVALRAGAISVSYGELNARANRLAHHLVEHGVSPGATAGIRLERSVDLIVAVLAVLKVGAAYVPLDPALPVDRVAYMVEETGTAVVIATAGASGAERYSAPLAPTLVLLDRDAADIDTCPTHNPGVEISSTDLAHVIYTSGSTGRPKGVSVEHRSVVGFLQAMATRPGICADDVVLGGTALSFDPSVLELFLPLIHGAQIVIADRDTMIDPGALASLLHRSGVTIMQATPTTWQMLVDDGWEGETHLTALYGGEPMSMDLLDAMVMRCRSLWNLYGPTETTVWATVHEVDGPTDRARRSVPVGRPVDNVRCYVLDPRGRPVPKGVSGELFIGGPGVARGYANRPDLTAERFLPDPFADVADARMYRTGDLARLLSDGTIALLGRADHQIKIRGHRIELSEIEHTLASHPAIQSAVVTKWEAGPKDVRLAAYYVPHGKVTVDSDELRTFLRLALPAYMIPAAYVAMDSFPLTPSKKIARNQLPAPVVGATAARAPSHRAPRRPIEVELARVWSELLGHSDIGIHDDFFDLGGHSLLAIEMFAAMERRTGRRLPLPTLFQAPTIEALACRYEQSSTTDIELDRGWTSLMAVQPDGTRPPFFYVSPFLISVLSFAHLARCMRPDQPFFLFQPQGMDGDHPVHERVEDMAAHYIAEMRQVQESGPYRIGGHCAGSWVAFEMARQLQQDGDEVALLLAVDAAPPGVVPPPVRLRHVFGRLRSYRRDGILADAVNWQVRVRRELYFSRRFGTGETRRLAAVRYAHAEAHRSYVADAAFDGDLLLIRSEDWARRRDKDWHLQWRDLITGELILDSVDGTHGDLVTDTTAASLAQKIRAAVDRSS